MRLKYSQTALLVTGVCLLGLGTVRQLTMSATVADAHEYTPQHRLLFDWLNTHTHLDDVVLATAKDVNDLIPVFTQDRVFVPNGERTSASNQEIADRFLIAMKLLNRGEGDVRALLAQDVKHGEPPLGLTYTYFLFLGTDDWRLPDSQIDSMLAEYRALDLGTELAGVASTTCTGRLANSQSRCRAGPSVRPMPTLMAKCGRWSPPAHEGRDRGPWALGRLRPGARVGRAWSGRAPAHELPGPHRGGLRRAP